MESIGVVIRRWVWLEGIVVLVKRYNIHFVIIIDYIIITTL